MALHRSVIRRRALAGAWSGEIMAEVAFLPEYFTHKLRVRVGDAGDGAICAQTQTRSIDKKM